MHVVRVRRVRDFMTPLGEDEPAAIADAATDLPVLKPDDTLEHALRLFDSSGNEKLPVADPEDETKLMGWANQVHALRYFNSALIEESREAHLH